jgi:SAM-dependent methyltransferase
MTQYQRYYAARAADRDDLLTNREVLFQAFAFEKANTRAIQSLGLDRASARVLDVGCGSGAGLMSFIRWGFSPANLSGIDVNADRVAHAREAVPGADIRAGDASRMEFTDASFDLVFESTMFLQMTDETLAASIAREMIRVTRPGGFIVLADWRYGKPRNPDFIAVSPARISKLFATGSSTTVVRTERGALVPPVGRFLSRSLPGLYFATQSRLPFLVGQVTTVLRRN